MQTISAAIIGTGFMAPAHTEALRRLGVTVAGILGSSAEKSQRAAAALGIRRAYRNLEELLADADVQVVHVTSPNRWHFAQASALLRAGKHVLCEKPLAMNATESAALVELARQSGCAAGVNYNIRFYPLCLEARERVARGDVGEVLSVTGSYVQDWLLYPTDYNWRVLESEGGALRAVADIGTHWLDLLQTIMGQQVTAVFAELQTVHPQRRRPTGEVETFTGASAGQQTTHAVNITTEDHGAVLLRFANGARGVLWVSQVTAGRKNCLRFEIAGAKAALAWNSEQPEELWLGRREQANELLLRDPSLLTDAARHASSYPGEHAEGYPDSFKQCFRAFYDAIASGDFQTAPKFPTFADGHREILLCEAILQSQREQRWVELDLESMQ
ncbi:MAG: Gfo/Idh/MocA family oxidoreductase [Acidobacteriota bacterium]